MNWPMLRTRRASTTRKARNRGKGRKNKSKTPINKVLKKRSFHNCCVAPGSTNWGCKATMRERGRNERREEAVPRHGSKPKPDDIRCRLRLQL